MRVEDKDTLLLTRPTRILMLVATSLSGSAALGLLAAIVTPAHPEVAIGAAIVGAVGGFYANKLDQP